LQYVRGAMTIGKIQMIKVVPNYFLSTQNKQKQKVMTYITNVALLINKTTIHVL
jgi:hypothetical protein